MSTAIQNFADEQETELRVVTGLLLVILRAAVSITIGVDQCDPFQCIALPDRLTAMQNLVEGQDMALSLKKVELLPRLGLL